MDEFLHASIPEKLLLKLSSEGDDSQHMNDMKDDDDGLDSKNPLDMKDDDGLDSKNPLDKKDDDGL